MSKRREHKDILNRLAEMQSAPYYAAARSDLAKAEASIVALEDERDALCERLWNNEHEDKGNGDN